MTTTKAPTRARVGRCGRIRRARPRCQFGGRRSRRRRVRTITVSFASWSVFINPPSSGVRVAEQFGQGDRRGDGDEIAGGEVRTETDMPALARRRRQRRRPNATIGMTLAEAGATNPIIAPRTTSSFQSPPPISRGATSQTRKTTGAPPRTKPASESIASGPISRLSRVATNPHGQAITTMPVRTRPLGIRPVRTSSSRRRRRCRRQRDGQGDCCAGHPPADDRGDRTHGDAESADGYLADTGEVHGRRRNVSFGSCHVLLVIGSSRPPAAERTVATRRDIGHGSGLTLGIALSHLSWASAGPKWNGAKRKSSSAVALGSRRCCR